ncbi:MAG: mechanosensitive ion channel [Acidimicrobiales bacterium]|nr:mechanosensitive ion channel [Acidimicrobiales bacterium]
MPTESQLVSRVLAQVKAPSSSTTLANPAGDMVEEIQRTGVAEWFATRGLAIVVIVVVAFFVNRVARFLIRRSLERMIDSGRKSRLRQRLMKATPTILQRTSQVRLRTEARVQTLISVFRGVATVLVWFVAVAAILGVLRINLGPVLASAGVIGVALGFGAQNMVRDFLAGFFIIVEDQFGVGDIVDLGDAKGTVEKVSLRSTRLRDVHGAVWHVPNGQITRVANKSQEWARAVLDVEVTYDTDIDRAEQIIEEVANELARDEAWRSEIIDAPEVWGVENFTATGVVIRCVIKTQPASQFGVLRELRGRLKHAFDEAGIAMPGSRDASNVPEGGAPAPVRADEVSGPRGREGPSLQQTPGRDGGPGSDAAARRPAQETPPTDESPRHPRRGDAAEA